MIIRSLNLRNADRISGKVAVLDRGTTMFKAVAAATFLVQNPEANLESTCEHVDSLFSTGLDYQPEELDLLLVKDEGYRKRVSDLLTMIDVRSSQYTEEERNRYGGYLSCLDRTLRRYYSNDRSIVIPVDDCILEVQNRIRTILAGHGVELNPLCKSLDRLLTLGGLSESGKSSLADGLSRDHGYVRLKLRYFAGVIARRGDAVHPGTMGMELLEFLTAHRHITRVTLESLHSDGLPAYLKLLLGDRYATVYIDTPEELRISRTVQATGRGHDDIVQEVRYKDGIKRAGGGERVKDLADIVLANEGSPEDTLRELIGAL